MLDAKNDTLCAASNKKIILEICHYVYTLYISRLWFKIFFKVTPKNATKGVFGLALS